MASDLKEYKLGNICEILSSKRIFVADYVSEGIPFYRSKEIIQKSLGREIDEKLYISTDKFDLIKKHYGAPTEGDILISAVGERSGIPYLVQNETFYFKDGNLIWLRNFDKSIIDSHYLCYWFKSMIGQSSLNNLMIGSAQRALTIIGIKGISIKLPPLEIQRKIAKVLGTIDDKIELNNSINNNLEQQAQAIFKSWFVDFEPFGGTMPDDWEILNFEQFISPRVEKSDNPEIPLYSVTDNGICPRDSKFNKNLSKSNTKNKIMYKGDLVFGMSREILNWGVFHDSIGAVSSAYNIYQINNIVDYKYLEQFIKSNITHFKDLIRPASREGQGIDKSALLQKTIYIPSADILEKYYSIENSLMYYYNQIKKETNYLIQLRDTLLPKLMSGEIDVSKVEINEILESPSDDKLSFSEDT